MIPFKEQPPTPHFPSSLSTSLPTSANILPPPPPQAVTLLLRLLAHICWATALTKYCAKNNICIRACNLKPKPKLVTPLKNKDWDTEVKSCKAGMQFGFCFLSQVSETAPINHRSYPQHTLTDSDMNLTAWSGISMVPEPWNYELVLCGCGCVFFWNATLHMLKEPFSTFILTPNKKIPRII